MRNRTDRLNRWFLSVIGALFVLLGAGGVLIGEKVFGDKRAVASVIYPRAAQLLQTRSEVERERQNQALLASLDRRQGMQLRLQEMVEGLSVIAMTYYGVSLAAYALKPVAKALNINESWLVVAAVPVVALLVMLNLRRLRKHLTSEG